MNGLALAGFVDGQRMANNDRRIQQQHDLSLRQQEQAYDYMAQANPLRLEAAGQQNAAAKQAYDYAAQANPLRLEAAGQQNAAAKQAYDYAAQANPLRLGAAQQQLALGQQTFNYNQQANPLRLEAAGQQNAAAKQAYDYTAQANPLRLGAAQQQLALGQQTFNYNQQANPLRLEAAGQQNAAAKQAYDYAAQANPLRLGAAQQQLDAGALDLHTNQQLQPMKNAYAVEELTKGLQQSRLDTATREYSLTGNIQPLEQQLSALYQDQVRITPNQDGTVSVRSEDGQHTFSSMNEFLGIVLQQQQQASQHWASAGNGWAYNKATGEAKQLYQQPNNVDFYTKERYKSLLAERKTLADQMNKGTDEFGKPLPEPIMQQLQQRMGALDSTILSLTQGETDDPALSLYSSQPPQTPMIQQPEQQTTQQPSAFQRYNPMLLPFNLFSGGNDGATVSVDGSDQLFMPAPPEAIRFLQENNTPAMQRAFVHKYHYLPEFVY
jgi:hypothetical protein